MCFKRNAVERATFLRQCWGHLDKPPDNFLRRALAICSGLLHTSAAEILLTSSDRRRFRVDYEKQEDLSAEVSQIAYLCASRPCDVFDLARRLSVLSRY